MTSYYHFIRRLFMKVVAYSLLLSAFFYSCGVDRSFESASIEEKQLLNSFQNVDSVSSVKIANKTEAGQTLKLCLTVVNQADGQPMEQQRVYLYHTNIEGEYEPAVAGDESSARLHGAGFTDSEGRLFVETILPGDYGSSEDNRHIHTAMFGAEPEGYDIQFKQYASFMLRRFVDNSDQHFLAELKLLDDGSLVAFVTLEVKYPSFEGIR